MAQDAAVLRALIDANPQACFALDCDLRYLAFNRAHAAGMRALYGAEIEPGRRLTDYQTVAADREGAELNLRRALAGERVVIGAFSGEEGKRRYYDLMHVPLVQDDEITGVIVITADVTERQAAEEEQRESEARYRGYFEQPLVGAAVTSPDKGWIDVNQAACDLLGYTREELAALTWDELTHPDDLAADVACFDRVVAGEIDAYRLEKRFIRKGGAVIDVDLSVQCRRTADGGVDYFLALILDITKRKRTEAVRAFLARTGSASQDEPFFKTLARYLADSLGMFYVCIDRLEGDGLMARTVAVWCEDHFEDNVTYALADTPCGQVADEGVCCFPASVQQFFPRDRVLQDLHAESYIGATLYGRTGLPIGLIAVIGHEPLADRKLAEETLELVAARAARELERMEADDQLRETRDYLENLFGHANAPVIVWGADLHITRFNHAFEELTQRTAAEVVGKPLDLLFPDDERRSAALDHVTSATSGEERWQVVEIPILRADGEVRTVLWNSATVYAADGATPLATIAQGQDITERKAAEEEVQRLNADLERSVAERTRDLTAANAELEEFVHSIAHDLRSPLRALSGFSQLIETDFGEVLDDAGRDYLRRIREAAGHLGSLMDALLSLSRIGRRELDIGDVDLSALAVEVAQDLQKGHPERIADFEIENGLIARGDPALCEIVVQNLLENAWKFSAGEEHAHIRFSAVRANGGRAFCVSDNGVGFNPEFAGKLFSPFERLHTRDEFSGTGIGLATVRRVVTRLGGRCWADAEEDGGARVYFSLGEAD
jgi:PAS domain S-box-containing protein